jgi:glyoxylase-like metal-dependent hydrolase (beta-lactamase superfamily II)
MRAMLPGLAATLLVPGNHLRRHDQPAPRGGQPDERHPHPRRHFSGDTGFGNTMLVVTGEGSVIIDTSSPNHAGRHKKLLQAENAGPIKYIVLTHGHGDHTGGIRVWKQEATQIIAQTTARSAAKSQPQHPRARLARPRHQAIRK